MSGTNSSTEVDQGLSFGTWDDPTSRLIYSDAMPALLSGTPRDKVLDLGGGNGLLREWFPDVTTVDSDPAKKPDVVADLRTYVPTETFDRVMLRYVLHYLTDAEVIELFGVHLPGWHHGEVTVIQFIAADENSLRRKLANSVNETKFFRTLDHLMDLFQLTGRWDLTRGIGVSYEVHPDFYRNRLGATRPTGHPETVLGLTLTPRDS